MITKKQLTEALQQLKLQNACVCLHTSVRSFADRLEGGPESIPQALLEEGCTLLVPTFSDMYEAAPVEAHMPPRNGAGDYSYFRNKTYENSVFCVSSNRVTVEEMGILPKAVLEMPEHIRGDHPLNSFTAVGPQAEELIRAQTVRHVYAPLEQLYKSDGFVLLAGVDLTSATAIHYAEQKAGRNPFIRWAKAADGTTVGVCAGGCSDGFERLAPHLRSLEKTVWVGKSLWRCYRMRELVDACVRIMQEDPQITHCEDPGCARCNDGIQGGPIMD